MWAGREFQREGAIAEKARSPYFVDVRGPGLNCIVNEEQRGLEEVLERKEMRSVRYFGACPFRIVYVSRRTLKDIR